MCGQLVLSCCRGVGSNNWSWVLSCTIMQHWLLLQQSIGSFVSCACSLGTAEKAVQLVVGCCATFGMTTGPYGATASLHTSVSRCRTVEVYDSALSWAPGLVEYDVHLCVSVHMAAHTFWRMYDEAV